MSKKGIVTKEDWHLYKEFRPQWMERHLDKLCREYMEILSGEASAFERFWTLQERLQADRKEPGMVSDMCRSEMAFDIIIMLRKGMINREDLAKFSDELRQDIEFALGDAPLEE